MSTKGKILFVLVIVIVAMALAIPAVVSARTYDYSDTPLLHKAYKGNVSSWGPLDQKNNPPGTEIEMDAAEYTAISSSNDSRAEFSEVDEYEFHRFVFKIDADVSDISQIYVLHEGYGTKPGGSRA